MKVKICGLTSLQDAQAALTAGADLLGFNFYPSSPRYLNPVSCAALVTTLRKQGCRAQLVGVFVNSTVAHIEEIMSACRLDLAQLSGDEPPDVLAALGPRAFKALRPASAADLAQSLMRFTLASPKGVPHGPAWLVDAYRPGEFGGTGQAADWGLAAGLAARVPILLAGGLHPENVATAIRAVRPWGVDVASGIETAPGRKDVEKMQAFVRAARAAQIG